MGKYIAKHSIACMILSQFMIFQMTLGNIRPKQYKLSCPPFYWPYVYFYRAIFNSYLMHKWVTSVLSYSELSRQQVRRWMSHFENVLERDFHPSAHAVGEAGITMRPNGKPWGTSVFLCYFQRQISSHGLNYDCSFKPIWLIIINMANYELNMAICHWQWPENRCAGGWLTILLITDPLVWKITCIWQFQPTASITCTTKWPTSAGSQGLKCTLSYTTYSGCHRA